MHTARLLGLWMTLALIAGIAHAQPFTYQGMLKQNGQPVNATLSMTFKLYDALTGGNQVGSAITQNVSVQNGLFTVQLDFGSVWTGADRYLEITVGANTLSPRVKITPTPYASYAAFAQRPWQTVGSNIFYTSGNVGIGTNNPAARLSLGGGDANTKLALWQGNSATDVMGFGIAPNQFRIHLHNPSNRFSFLDAPNGNEIMTILGNGNAGMGVSSPSERLHVNGNIRLADDRSIFGLDSLVGYNDLRLFGDASGGPDVYIDSSGNVNILGNLHVGGNLFTLGGGTDSTWRRVQANVSSVSNSEYVGVVQTFGANGNLNTDINYVVGYPNHGAIGVFDAYGSWRAAMAVASDGNGWVVADTKNFRVPDPDDATRDIWYGCIEGPELAMYVRGTARLVNGRARIELPDHFRKLADEQGMTVQLTPRSAESKGLAAVQVSLNGIEVVELLNGRGNYEFDWEVKAVRKEHRDFRVYRSWDEVMPGGVDPAQAWEARLKSIQDRQARQQAKENK